jgi:hypothetical protein
MTEWLIHDLSIDGQYPTPAAFIADFETLLRTRAALPALREGLSCTDDLGQRPVSGGTTLREAVRCFGSREIKYIALQWLTRGPFWQSHRQPFDADTFDWEGKDVTEQGLGEATRRKLSRRDARTISFEGIAAAQKDSLSVGYLRPDSDLEEIGVQNVWQMDCLRDLVLNAAGVTGWDRFLVDVAGQCSYITFNLKALGDQLRKYPFDQAVVDRAFFLFGVLQNFMALRHEHGDGSSQLTDLLNLHFVGGEAPFSDSSRTEMKKFSERLIFPDPTDPGTTPSCPWHGKVRTPLPYRIHFQWPVPKGQEKLKVVYFGPKLTKK